MDPKYSHFFAIPKSAQHARTDSQLVYTPVAVQKPAIRDEVLVALTTEGRCFEVRGEGWRIYPQNDFVGIPAVVIFITGRAYALS